MNNQFFQRLVSCLHRLQANHSVYCRRFTHIFRETRRKEHLNHTTSVREADVKFEKKRNTICTRGYSLQPFLQDYHTHVQLLGANFSAWHSSTKHHLASTVLSTVTCKASLPFVALWQTTISGLIPGVFCIKDKDGDMIPVSLSLTLQSGDLPVRELS
jgi:hypothetical protein